MLWPQGDGAAIDVLQYSPGEIRLRVFGEGERAVLDPNLRWEIDAARPAPASLVIEDGDYPVAPGSLHRIEWSLLPPEGEAQVARVGRLKRFDTLTAGADGRLVIQATFTDELIRLRPVGGPAPGADAG